MNAMVLTEQTEAMVLTTKKWANEEISANSGNIVALTEKGEIGITDNWGKRKD